MELSIPTIAHRYNPSSIWVFSGTADSIQRSIFYTSIYTDYETTKLKEFASHIKTHLEQNQLPAFFKDPELLRILIKCKFDIEKSFTNLLTEIEWRNSLMPNSYHSLLTKVENLLDLGIIYIHGRDNRFRPLIIIDCEKLRHKYLIIDSIFYMMSFLIEFTKQKLMLSGKIENFILITDANNMGLRLFPSSELKILYEVFQQHFRYMLAINYIVNAPKTLSLAKFFLRFMDKETAFRTKITRSNGFELLQQHFSLTQLEEKYGGKANNASHYWPPYMPDEHFAALGEPEDIFLTPDDPNESDFVSISEKISLHLPFQRQDVSSYVDISVKVDTEDYRVNVDVPASIDDIEIQNISVEANQFEPEQIEVPEKKPSKCCKNLNCTIL
ncbi:hypothetical protein SteCoe_37387 [Stentor coeruleus]|uniref:CRAL-TRIO domain-containing protein n=1 Tax=Stentor coeruleus TaxID=5963 RepID=A0A1R2ANC6_9CILI|nr:hypothetical protein SteCoe_37387 [Stentor coeruleus]